MRLSFLPSLLLLFLTIAAGAAEEGARKYGFGFHLGSGAGLSMEGFASHGVRWETRGYLGFKVEGLANEKGVADITDTLETKALGLVASLRERFYFYKGLYVCTGVSVFPAEILSEIEEETLVGKRTYQASHRQTMVQVPFLLGIQLERNRAANLHLEAGWVSQVNHRGETLLFDNHGFASRYRHPKDEFVTGLGLTFNFNDW